MDRFCDSTGGLILRYRAAVAIAAAVLSVAAGGISAASGPAASSPAAAVRAVELAYPHAGVAITIPKGFEIRPAGETHEVVKAVLEERGEPAVSIGLWAMPADANDTAASFAESRVAELQGALAVRNFKVSGVKELSAGGLAGRTHILSYTFAGQDTAAAQAFFIRRLDGSNSRVCYVLTVEAAGRRRTDAPTMLDEAARGLRFIRAGSPLSLEIERFGPAIDDPARGFTVPLPHGWHARPTPAGLELGQADYLAGGDVTLGAVITAVEVPGDFTSRQCETLAARAFARKAADRRFAAKVLSQGTAVLAGVEGRQFVFLQTPAAKPAETRPAATTGTAPSTPPAGRAGPSAVPDYPEVRVHRNVMLPPGGDGRAVNLAVILVARGTDDRRAAAVMDKLAGAVGLLKPTSRPATEPATQPPAP